MDLQDHVPNSQYFDEISFYIDTLDNTIPSNGWRNDYNLSKISPLRINKIGCYYRVPGTQNRERLEVGNPLCPLGGRGNN